MTNHKSDTVSPFSNNTGNKGKSVPKISSSSQKKLNRANS